MAPRNGQPTRFSALFEPKDEKGQPQAVSPVLLPFIPDFDAHLVDLSQWSDAEIRGEIWTRVFQLILKHIFDKDLGRRLPAIFHLLRDLARQESGLAMLRTILRYIARAGRGATREEVQQTLLETFPQDGGVLMKTMAEEWIEEGRAEKQAEALHIQRAVLLQILQHRFMVSNQQIQMLTRQLEEVKNLTQFSVLTNHALDAVSVDDFAQRLQQHLAIN